MKGKIVAVFFVAAILLSLSAATLFPSSLNTIFAQASVVGGKRPIIFNETSSYVKLNFTSLVVEFYKGTTGYNKIYDRTGNVLVYDDRMVLEYFSSPKWKQRGTPIDITWTKIDDYHYNITRLYDDYLGTTYNITYTVKSQEPMKISIDLYSGQTDEYRLYWSPSGITKETWVLGNNSVTFDERLRFDWEDVYLAFGNITDVTVETVAEGKKANIYFNIGIVNAGQTLILDPQVEHVYYWENPSFQRRNFHANGYFWQFYVDVWDYDFCYESSVDGETWANKVIIYGGGDPFQESMRATEAGIYLETDTLVHMVYANYNSEGESGSRHSIFYRTGTLGEGTISLGTQYGVAVNIDGFNAPTVTVDSNGYPWIGYNVKNTGYFVKKATTTSGSAWGSATQLFTPDSCSFFYHSGVILPLDNGKMYVVWEDNHPGGDSDDGAQGRLYNGASWEAGQSIWYRSDLSSSHHNKMRYSVVVKSNHDIIYFRDARYHQTNGDVTNNGTWVYEYDYSGDSWSRTKQVSTGGTAGFVTIDKTTDDMWFFYTHINTGSEDVGDGIYYVEYTNSSATWGDEVTVDATVTSLNHLHGFYEPRDGYLGIAYVVSDWLYFTYLTTGAPTIGEFQAASTVYAFQQITLNATVSDPQGKTTLKNASLTLSADNIMLKWINSTNTFSMDDPNNKWEFVSGSRTDVSTAYKLTWTVKSYWNSTEGYISISEAKVYDEDDNIGTNSESNWFYNENDLIIDSADVDDSRVNPTQSLTFSGQIYYQGTSTAPYTTSGITAKIGLTEVLKGSNSSIAADGSFTISFNAESTVDQHGYNAYCTTVKNSVQNQTVNVIVDRFKIVSIVADDDRRDIDTTVTLDVTIHYDYDSTAVTTGTFTLNTLSLTHQGSGVWQTTDSKSSVQDFTYNSVSGSGDTYGLNTVNMNSQSEKVVWDRFEFVSITASDTHAGISTDFELRYKICYDYDNVVFDSSKGSITGYTWDSANSWWDKTVTASSSVTSVNYDETYITTITDSTYGLTVKQDVAGVDVVTFTLGEFAADATVYANNYTFVNATFHTGDSAYINSFINGTVELSNNVVLKWINSTDTFSIVSDPNNYCTIDAPGSSKTSVNSTAFKLSWRIKLNWTYPEGSKSIVAANTKAYDVNSYASNSKTDLFTFEDDLIVYSASVDDSHVDPSQSITFSGTLYHQGTTSPPGDTNGITAKVLLVDTGQVKGSTTSIEANGDFTINIFAPSTIANYTYRLYAITDQYTVQNQTLYVVVDRLIIQLNANTTYLDIDETVGSNITAKYEYSDQPVTSWTINILRNETHFATGNFTDSMSIPCKNTYEVENVSETVYGLTAYTSNVLTVYWASIFVEVDEIQFEKNRLDVNSTFYLLYHVRWGSNQSNCYPCILAINGTEVAANSTGWINFETSLTEIGKFSFIVTSVNASGETDYGQIPPDPEITADKLYVTFGASNTSPVKGETVTISWVIKRLFDNTICTDFVIDIAINGELRWIDLSTNGVDDVTTQPLTRTYDVYMHSVTDNTYGLTLYDSKSVTVIWHEAAPPPSPPPAPTNYLLGVVVRTTLGDPVADLTIEIYIGDRLVTSGTTDPEGTYTAILPPNIYKVVVVLNGETVTDTVELYDNKSVDITVPSAPTPAIGQFITVVLVMIILIVGLAFVPRALKQIKI